MSYAKVKLMSLLWNWAGMCFRKVFKVLLEKRPDLNQLTWLDFQAF